MKRVLLLSTLLVSVVIASSAAYLFFADDNFLSIAKEVIYEIKPVHYASPPPPDDGMKTLATHIKEGNWQLLKDYFINESDYEAFLDKLSYAEDDPYLQKRKKKITQSRLSRMKPFSLKQMNGNDIDIANLKDGSLIRLNFNTTIDQNNFKVESVNVIPLGGSGRQSSNGRSSAREGGYNYILLPSGGSVKPEYFDSFSEYYSAIEEKTEAAGMPFQQIDFDPLIITFKWCKKVLFVRKCGTETYVLEYGPVLSDKDVPENETEYKVHYFHDIADITAYAALLNPGEYSPNGNNYVLTSVVADITKASLTFLREGLEPWTYGLAPGEVSFETPIAVKVIDGKLYVLDKGHSGIKPSVKVFEVFNTMIPDTEQGDFGVTYIGTIDANTLNGFEFDKDVFDIGGFEGETASQPNTLLVADANGIHGIELERSTGMPGASPFIKSITAAQDPLTLETFDFVKEAIRLDARKAEGGTDNGNVVLISPSQLTSFSLNQFTQQNTQTYARYNFKKRLDRDAPVNLAYMFTEKKWYVLDRYGKIHKLSKDGKYISGGGRSGKSETNEELYFPTAITPNPIESATNDFRFRYIVANEWGFDTGFKLFAPDMNLPEFKVFEDLTNDNLAFTFTTSGPFAHLENTTGITLQSLKVNGVAVPQNLWSDDILPGTAQAPGDDLTSVPNVASIQTTSLSMLRRGWNTAIVEVKLFMNAGEERVLTKETRFYWLPSTFTPTSFANGDFKVNKVSDPSAQFGNDTFIYKPIEIGTGGALYVDNANIHVLEEGSVTFKNGSTFYNKSGRQGPLENIAFASDSKFTFESGAHICVSGTGAAAFSTEDYAQQIVLNDGYVTGVNPAGLPEYAGSQCNSPCYFMTKEVAKAAFKTSMAYDVTSNFQVTVDPEGTTFNEKVKWEVEKIVDAGLPNQYDSEVINEKADVTNLTAILNYNFETCSQYKITMSIGCTGEEFIASTSKTIPTPRCESKLAAGYYHSMKIKPDGTLWSWGNNDFGQLGEGTTDSKTYPVKIGNDKWKAVSSGYFHSVGIKEDGSLWAWGYNGYGQLGDGSTEDRNTPQKIGLSTDWKSVSVGATHSVAIKNDGTLWSWGGNDFGQLGIGNYNYQNIPTQIGTASNWAKISCGYYHTIALKSDGSLWGWGYNGIGELGDGTNADKTSPIRIGTETNWALIGCGADHSMAIKNNGTLWTWGYNTFGQLGNGSTENSNVPQQINSTPGWRNVLGGEVHTMAIRVDGTVWSWGGNYAGQLGDETSTDKLIPSIVRLETNWDNISLGGAHSIVTSIDKICAVGNNSYGQLGDGSFQNKNYFNCDSPPLNAINERKNTARIGPRLTEVEIRSNTLKGEQMPSVGQNYPNPANSGTTINYNIPNHVKEAKLIIYDSQNFMKIQEYDLSKERGELNINVSKLKPGIYIYEVIMDGNKKGVKRMVVIR